MSERTVLRIVGGDLSSGLESISSFPGLPHRLQSVGERAGVRYVNDSISSTPVATIAALETVDGRPVTLLLGGLDRGLEAIIARHARVLNTANLLSYIRQYAEWDRVSIVCAPI